MNCEDNISISTTCDICLKPAQCTLCSSAIAPVTYCRCNSCSNRKAEKIGIVIHWIAENIGADPKAYGDSIASPYEQYAPIVTSNINGKYVGWKEIFSVYQNTKADRSAENNEEIELVDIPSQT